MARSAFVLGNFCEVSEDTERAKVGDFAVVQTVDDKFNGNNGTIWIMKSKEAAMRLSRHVKAVDTGSLATDVLNSSELEALI